MNAQSTSALTTSLSCSTNLKAAPSPLNLRTADCLALPYWSMETNAAQSGTVHVRKTNTHPMTVHVLVLTFLQTSVHSLMSLLCALGRCSMFPDLNVITFDGNSVAIYKAASYIVTQLPNETISILVQECPADSESNVSQYLT